MRSTTSGLLLLLIGVAALAGFLTGNLDRWIAYLFDPSRPSLAALATAPAGTLSPAGAAYYPSSATAGGIYGERRAS